MKPIYLPIPIKLQTQLNSYISENHAEYIKNIDLFYYFVGMLLIKMKYDKRKNNLPKNSNMKLWINLNSQILHKIFSTRLYKKILNILVDSGILLINEHYSSGRFSKGYIISDKYVIDRTMTYEIKNKTLLRRIKKDEVKKFTEIPEIVKESFNILQNNFTYDAESARKFLQNDIELKKKTEEPYTECQEYTLEYQINELENKDYYLQYSEKTGRMFHNYTNLSSKFRKFIQHKSGEKLVEIDISNSQPFFLGCDIKNKYNTEDSTLYTNLVRNGDLYKYLLDNISTDINKVNILKILFSRNNSKCKFSREFKNLFPTISEEIKNIKKSDHRNLAVKLQRMESEMILSKISPILIKHNIDYITIHDSFIVPESKSEQVKQIIQTEFYNKYGMIPKLKIK